MSYATDEILRFRMEEVEALNESDEQEAERWEWHAEHKCDNSRVAIARIEDSVFTESCCLLCYNKVWRHEGAAIIHHSETQLAA